MMPRPCQGRAAKSPSAAWLLALFLATLASVTSISDAMILTDPCCYSFKHMPAAFGPRYAGHAGVGGKLYDTSVDDDRFMCDTSSQNANVLDKVAFIPRGRCRFVDKVLKAQESGAKAAVIYNTEPPLDGYTLVHMSVDDPSEATSVSIPAVFVSFLSAETLFELLDENNEVLDVFINGTDEYDSSLYDETPAFMSSILFMLQLLMIVWSIIAIFYLVNWVRLHLARRRRLEVVRKLPTRIYRSGEANDSVSIDLDQNANGDVDSPGAAGAASARVAPSYEIVSSAEDLQPIGDHLELVDMGTPVVPSSDDERHPRHPEHHRVPVDEVEVDLTTAGVTRSAAGAGTASLAVGAGSSSSTGSGAQPTSSRFTDYFACENCVICICDFEDGEKLTVLPCGHGYHKECIEPWLIHKSALCPICKQSILPSGDSRSLDEIAAADATNSNAEDSSEASRSVAIILAGVVAIATGSTLLYFMQADA
mmetsp:Transcript_16283/g.31572  ORF Transcript_16283/g.31572 Transcript_16283/m.31572 type:complete len:480 (+) Transcript_16283:413-1852(+)